MQPPALRDRPVLQFHEEHYLRVFDKASKYRQYTMAGPLPIPTELALTCYCNFYGIHDVELREQMAYMVERLDEVYLTEVFKKSSSETPTKSL